MHGGIAAVLIALAIDEPAPSPRPASAPVAVEVVDRIAVAPTVQPSGGTPASSPSPAAAPARIAAAAKAAPRRSPTSVRELIGATVIDAGDAGGGASGGTGRGGFGGGTGIGIGDGPGVAVVRELPLPPPPPPPPKVSKARPARLIYPARSRDAGEEEMFHARVIVDRDGYVVGARIRATGRPGEDLAAQAIWRFRYEPALDDEGRAIQSTVDQPFLVNRW
jgi:hypothetical protein